MVKKLLCLFFLLTLSNSVFSQDEQDLKDLEILESGLNGIHDVVASPNPFSVTTRIRFMSDEEYEMDFLVKDLLGNTIYMKKLTTKKGPNTIPFFRDDLESGIYIYSLKTKTKVVSKRIVIK